jgi:hypothetical protein
MGLCSGFFRTPSPNSVKKESVFRKNKIVFQSKNKITLELGQLSQNGVYQIQKRVKDDIYLLLRILFCFEKICIGLVLISIGLVLTSIGLVLTLY